MKKKTTFTLIICLTFCIAMIPMDNTKVISNNIQPISSGPPLGFSITNRNYNYDECGDFLEVSAKVKNTYGNWPDAVYVEINGTNHSMTMESGVLNSGFPKEFDIIDGVDYFYYLEHPAPQDYNFTFHAFNSTIVKSTSEEIYTLDTDQLGVSLTKSRIYGNKYEFRAQVSYYGCEELIVNLTINGINETLTENYWDINTDKLVYTYIKDWGNTDNETYTINVTVNAGDLYENDTLADFYTESIRYTEVTMVQQRNMQWTEQGITMDAIFQVKDSHNIKPEEIIIQMNTTNYTIPVVALPEQVALLKTDAGDCMEDYWFDTYLDEVNISLDYNKAHELTIWVNNGSWFNASYYYLDNVGPEPPENPYSIEIVNASIFEYDNAGTLQRKLNITLELTSPLTAFTLTSGNLQLQLEAPALGYRSLNLIEVEGGDSDFTDGKLFSTGALGYYLNDLEELWWGNIEYYITFNYRYETNLLSEFAFKGEFPTTGLRNVTGTEGGIGEYGIKSEKRYEWSIERIISNCCDENMTISEEFYFEVVDFGRYLGSDYIDYVFDEKTFDSCNPEEWNGLYETIVYNNWVSQSSSKRNYHGNVVRVYINPEYPETYPYIEEQSFSGWLIIPFSHINNFSEFLTDNSDAVRFNKIEDENIWTSTWIADNYTHTITYEFTSKGILKIYSNVMSCGDFYYGTMITLKGFPLWATITIIIGSIVALAGISLIILKKKRGSGLKPTKEEKLDKNIDVDFDMELD